jgi:thioester reductase-like protein
MGSGMRGTHLLTGGTGFLGSAMLLNLLTHTENEVWCVVRGKSSVHAQARLHDALTRVADVLDRTGDLLRYDVARRCRVVRGDVREPLLGLNPEALPRIGCLWACAASLRYEVDFSDEIHEANVRGARHAISLAQWFDAQLNYVSTAYVFGQERGKQFEMLPPARRPTNNLYEHSKIAAENLVADSVLDWRVLRPGAVVGDSGTLRTPGHSGLYDIAVKVRRFRRQYQPRFPELLTRQAVLAAEADNEVHLVPLDQVAGHGVLVGLHGEVGKIFHLTNATPPHVDNVYGNVFEWAGLPRPVFEPHAGPEHLLDQRLARALAFHLPYTVGHVAFDRTNTEAVVGAGAMEFPMPDSVVAALVARYGDEILTRSST